MSGNNHSDRRRARRTATGLFLATLFIASQTSGVKSTLPLPIGYNGDLTLGAAEPPPPGPGQAPNPILNSHTPGTKVEDADLLDYVKARGFIGERYLIKSRDGAPLSVYHVINPHANPRTLNRFPVLVLHGVTTDAASMVAHSEHTRARPPTLGRIVIDPVGDTSLALTLSNNNFDVWLADARGTNMNNHLYAQEIDPVAANKFWNFSLDEQVHYDLPALIEFVLQQTHANKLHYIGFSESTFMMFALLSQSAEYQAKVASFVALAPVAHVSHIRGLALSLFTMASLTADSIQGSLIPQALSDAMSVGVRNLCKDQFAMRAYCTPLVAAISGEGEDEDSRDFLSSLLKGTSLKAVKHFIQLHNQKRFGMYDHGAQENLRLYGSVRPPDYNLANIRLPSIILFRGAKDYLSDPEDQQTLLEQLGTKPYRDFDYKQFNHVNFLSGATVVRDVNQPAAELMLELAKWNAAQMGARSVLRDPEQANKPPPYKPLAVSVPDGSRNIQFKKDLASNLVNGLIQTKEIKKETSLSHLGGLGAALRPLAGADVPDLSRGFNLPKLNLPQQLGALVGGDPLG